MSKLCDYETAEELRDATDAERRASILAARTDGGAGVILVDGRAFYVPAESDDDDQETSHA